MEYIKNLEFYHGVFNGVVSESEKTGVTFTVTIDSQIILKEFTIFENITFLKEVIVEYTDIKSGFYFNNCSFEKGIVFKKVISPNFDPLLNKSGNHIHFKNCSISNLIFDESCQFARQIKIEDCPNLGKIILLDLNIGNGGFYIQNSTINDLFDITRLTSDLSLCNSEFKKAFRVETMIGGVVLKSSTFYGVVNLWNIECSLSLALNRNTFKDNFKIEASRIKGLFIHGDTFEKSIELLNKDVQGKKEVFCSHIYLTEANFSEGANFNGLGRDIDKITIRLSPNLKGLVNFEGWHVKDFQLNGVNENLKLLLKRMVFESTFIMNFSNYGDISFDKCKGNDESVLHLANCNFGKTMFNEFDFNSFKKGITVDNVAMDEIKAYNINWFNDDKLVISGTETTSGQGYKRRRELYKQLKHALKKNGNQIESLIFKAREVEAYQKELKQNTSAKWQDKFILWFSKTNNFGMSWWKPTWMIFLITFLFYLVVHPIFNDSLNYSCAKNLDDLTYTLIELWNNSKAFWQLFNPTRKFTTVYGATNNVILYCLDLLHRIVLGAFIFQIIRGFRKYAEK